MKTIHKYPLAISNTQIIEIPEGAEILTLVTQFGDPMIYALVDPDKPIEKKVIVMKGTGFLVDKSLKYIGTVLIRSDTLVWHFFEKS